MTETRRVGATFRSPALAPFVLSSSKDFALSRAPLVLSLSKDEEIGD